MASSIVFVITVGILFVWPIPRYLRLSPGPSPDVGPLVQVSGLQAYPPESRLGMALVIVGEVDTLFELARASLDDESEVVRREVVIPPEVSDEENDRQNAQLMTTSQENATVVALDYLGFDVGVVGKGVRVTQVVAGFPAEGKLQKDDIIVAVDGQPVSVLDDAVKAVVSKPIGSTLRFTVTRGGERFDVEVVSTESPDQPGRPIVGVTLQTEAPELRMPEGVKVIIDAGDIGGPSAGLVYTLAIIDALTPGDITGGHNIAATGEMRLDGSVGAVGGLREKAIGVYKAGAEYFLVPAGDNAAAAQAAAEGMTVVPVHTVTEALDFLKALRDGAELTLPR